MNHPLHHKTTAAKSRRDGQANGGFALIIALSLMAFVLLLLLSITTLTQVEIKTASLQKDKLEAQQNALLGLKLALGDLQKLSGSDQRITAAAAILDPTPTGPDSGITDRVTHPNWVGVWDSDPGLPHLNDRLNTADTYYNYGARRVDDSDNRFLGWLVSGNQDNITDRDATITAKDEVLIYGADFDSSDPEQLATQVLVEKMPINAGSANAGKYAYWVSDENSKARIDAYSSNSQGSSAESLSRGRFATNQRSAIELMDTAAFAEIPQNGTQSRLDFLLSPEDLPLALNNSANVLPAVRRNAHALTTTALGLLTNTYTSGLRIDLSSLLRQNPLDNALNQEIPSYTQDGASRLVKYPPSTANFSAPEAPTWEQLQSYAATTSDPDGSGVIARKHSKTEHGFYPLITRYTVRIVPVLENDKTSGDLLHFYLETKIAIVNPYNVPLQIDDSMYAHLFVEEYDEANKNGATMTLAAHKGYDRSPNPKPGRKMTTFSSDFFENSDLHHYTDSNGVEYNGFRFRLPNTTLLPGEVLSLGIEDDGAPYNGENKLLPGALDTGTFYSKLTHKDESGNIVRAPVSWSNLEQTQAVTAYWLTFPIVSGGLETVSDPKTESDRIVRILPFKVAIGISDTPEPSDEEDFYHLAQGIECANPNAVAKYHHGRSTATIGNWGIGNSYDKSLYDYSSNSKHMPITFDVVLNGGFDYPLNNWPTGKHGTTAFGYRLDHKWLRGYNFRAPLHAPVASDLTEKAPNGLYGAAAMYAVYELGGAYKYLDDRLAKMETFGTNAYWGTGNTTSDGLTQTNFYDLPSDSIGLLSLGQLQHFQISQITSSQPYSVGNGVAEMKIGDTGRIVMETDFQQESPVDNSFLPVDQAFLVNNALWDGFFFSGMQADINQADLSKWDGPPLQNRYAFSPVATTTRINNPTTAASELYVDGAFNINSTQKSAWKAILAGANGLVFDPVTGDTSTTLDSPVSRSVFPTANSGTDNEALINGFRQLTEAEINSLAATIVAEIKDRGPFLSLADFVNRKLEPGNTENGLYGTLEAALNKTTLNDDQKLDSFTEEEDLPIWSVRPEAHIKALFDGSRGESISQWITQADLLQRIAPFVSARGDTFTIRAYGETLDPTSDKVIAHALCEATVQRVYDYIDANSNTPEDEQYRFNNDSKSYENGTLNAVNQQFGRRYKITNIRWL
jgi:hypothetical protein